MKEEHFSVRHEHFSVTHLADRDRFPDRPSNNWKEWPEMFRRSTDAAGNRQMMQMPAGSKIIADYSRCDERVDLEGMPWQLYRKITVEIP